MKSSSGLIIITAGIGIIYMAVTGRYKCLTGFLACFSGQDCSCSDKSSSASSTIVKPLEPMNILPDVLKRMGINPTFPQ